jgi:hypothetical protein
MLTTLSSIAKKVKYVSSRAQRGICFSLCPSKRFRLIGRLIPLSLHKRNESTKANQTTPPSPQIPGRPAE